jgi:hypothetical protein
MTRDRRYPDSEVQEIFDLATTREGLTTPEGVDEDGLTLSQLQEVGREVGVAPQQVAEAALMVDSRRDLRTRETSLGLPVSVGRVMKLPRGVTDHEWDVLVSLFRETFGVRGKIRVQGASREWSHGTLHIFLEPTAAGQRLRLETRKLTARFTNRVGATGLVAGASLMGIIMATGQSPVFMEVGLLSSIIVTLGALVPNVVRLPLWARKKERQMEDLSRGVRGLLQTGEADGEG